MANKPIAVSCPADTWTEVATNVTAGNINRMLKDPNVYLQTWRRSGQAAPTSISEGLPIFVKDGDNVISSPYGIDVYIYPIGKAGKVRRDTP